MGLIDELLLFITSGSIAGLPPIVIMIIPLIVGLIMGFLVKKLLKIAVIATVIIFVVSYLGFFALSLATLKDLADQYGSLAVHYVVLLIGMLPLSIGFAIGLIIGFLFAQTN